MCTAIFALFRGIQNVCSHIRNISRRKWDYTEITNFTEQSPSSGANSRSDSQKFHASSHNFFKIYSNITLPIYVWDFQ